VQQLNNLYVMRNPKPFIYSLLVLVIVFFATFAILALDNNNHKSNKTDSIATGGIETIGIFIQVI
jgi:hypothetical protein